MHNSLRLFNLILLSAFLGVSSCKDDTSLRYYKGLARYGQIESKNLDDTIGPDFNSYLVFDKDASYYVTAKDSLDKDTDFQKRYFNKDSSRARSYSFPITSRFGRQVYFNRTKDSMYWRKWTSYYVSERKPIIKWQLIDETKVIADQTVYKAIGKYRGRIYTAWYSKAIPLPYGPWKLQGLP